MPAVPVLNLKPVGEQLDQLHVHRRAPEFIEVRLCIERGNQNVEPLAKTVRSEVLEAGLLPSPVQ